MHMSEHGRRLLTTWEGSRRSVYNDAAGKPTIGVGHLLTGTELASKAIVIDGAPVPYAGGLDDDEVGRLLAQDLRRYEDAVDRCVTVGLEQNQFDALVAFCFNVGVGAFEGSTLVKTLNQGGFADVPDELRRWTIVAGRTIPGMVNRREHEIDLWRGEAE